MRTKILLPATLVGIGVAWLTPASAQVQQAWAIPFTNGTPTELKLDGTGNVYVTGAAGTTKFDANGNSLWNITNGGVALALDAAYNVYLTGSSPGTNRFTDYLTTKLGPNGQLLWSVRYNGPGDRDDKPVGIAVDSAGHVYVTGSSTSTNYHLICPGIVPCQTNYDTDFATVKYDANGNQLWVAYYDGPDKRSDFPAKMAMDAAGNVYVTGISYPSNCFFSGALCESAMATVKYDLNGNQLWVARYNGPDDADWDDDEASDLAVDSAGNVHVTGYSVAPGAGYDYLTVKYDPNGKPLWIDRYNSAGNEPDDFLSYRDLAYAVAVGGAGCVYVSGEILGESSSWDFATIKYDASGNRLWLARYHAPTDESSTPLAIALDSADNVYVAGFTGATGGSGAGGDILTVKYDANGNQRWAARYRCTDRIFDCDPATPGAASRRRLQSHSHCRHWRL